jgi:hypothetical protein
MAVQPGRVGATTALVPLWPNKPVGGGGPTGPIWANAKGAISNVAVPNLKVFTPIRPHGAAMLVAAGGGYKRIEMATEALPAARWLADRGITAFVLSYRLRRPSGYRVRREAARLLGQWPRSDGPAGKLKPPDQQPKR